jgi:hypothetical protein
LVLCWGTLLWFLEGRKGPWTRDVLMDLLGRELDSTAFRHRHHCPGPRPGLIHRRQRGSSDQCHSRNRPRLTACQ